MGMDLRHRLCNEDDNANDNDDLLSNTVTNDSSGLRTNWNDLKDAPAILRPWIIMFRSLPTIAKIPFCGLDITFSLFCGLTLHLIRIMIAPVMTNIYGWPTDAMETSTAISCVVAMSHTFLLLPPLLICLLTQPYRPSASMESAPQWWQDASSALIQLCTGYMIQDSFITFFINKCVPGEWVRLSTSDWMFLGHHFATASYMLSALQMRAGHQSAMIIMYLGEFTSPAFNSFLITTDALNLGCCGATTELHRIIGIISSVLYVFFRVFVGPVAIVHLTYDLIFTFNGRKNVHLALSIYWIICDYSVLFGSLPWVFEGMGIIRAFLEGRSFEELE